jgi:NADH-quinone oxidoreductase subunit G
VWKAAPAPGAVSAAPLVSPIDNFFMTDAISRASATMAKCVQARQTMMYGR